MIKIDLRDYTIKEFLNDFSWDEGMETKKNIEYIKENLNNIIESEEESLIELVNNSENSIDMLRTIRDNRGEMVIVNYEGEELGSIGFYSDININN